MKKIILLFLFLSVFKETYSQNTFQKTYGISGEFGKSIQQTTDGGFIIAGGSYNGMFKDVCLIKTNSYGDTIWTKNYQRIEAGFLNAEAYAVMETTDGGFIITGYANNFSNGNYNYDVYLIKTTSNGDRLWTKTFGGSGNDFGYSVQQTIDGGYVIAGVTNSFNSANNAYLIKTDSNGNLLWSKTYEGGGVFSVQQTVQGGFIIAGGTASSGASGGDVYLIKTDANGNIVWSHTYGGIASDRAFSVQQTHDSGFIIAGETYSFSSTGNNVYLIKTDENGNISWSKTFGGTGGGSANDVWQTMDRGFIITGSTAFGSGGSDVYLIKTTASGNLEWSKTFGRADSDIGHCVQQTTDGGFIIAGITVCCNYSATSEIYLIKTDSFGNSGCNETNPQTIQTDPATIQGTPVTTITIPLTQVGSPSTFVGNNKSIQTNLCSNSVMTGIVKTENSSSLIVYPNPTAGVFQVNYSSTEKSNLSLTISDSNGKRIYTDGQNFFSGQSFKTIDLSKQSKGTYFIELITNGKKSVEKIILN